jgi:hypothetical protein
MNPLRENNRHLNRRHFFGRTATGIGTAALASLLSRDGFGSAIGADANPATAPKRFGGLPGLPTLRLKRSE